MITIIAVLFYVNTRNETANVTKTPITNYDECIGAGNPSSESYPAQCKTSDGQSFTQEIGNENQVSEMIRSENPRPNQTIASPLQIKGTAVGNWFFEASFPAQLVDANGTELAVIPVTAKGEWMTENFIPYSGIIEFATPQTPTGTLVLKRSNASGLPENDSELRIPVKFSQHSQSIATTSTVKVFFSNSTQNAECENVIAVSREINRTTVIARATLDELIKGLTDSEKNRGYVTSINANTKINSLNIKDGTATVDFSAELEQDSGGSCRAQAVRSQITQTLKQFPTVNNVIITVNGKADVLQP